MTRASWHEWWWDTCPEWMANLFGHLPHRLACWVVGHLVIDDQCNKPEHRYCVWCNKATPNWEDQG